MRLAFAADFHGSRRHFSQFLDLARQEQADLAVVGGDLFPIARPYEEMLRVQKQFASVVLPDMLQNHRNLGGCPIYLLPGNNDWNEAFLELCKVEREGLVACAGPAIYNLADGFVLITQPFVPPTPFRMKDFDRRDLAMEPCPEQPNPIFYSEGDEIKQADIGSYLSGRPSIEEEMENIGMGPEGQTPKTPAGPHPSPLPKGEGTGKHCALPVGEGTGKHYALPVGEGTGAPAAPRSGVGAEKAICVMHSPPFGTGLDRTAEGVEVGSKAIRAAIENYQPLLSLHGHIHEAPKVAGTFACRLGRTISVNPGQRISQVYAVVIDLGPTVVLRHTELGVLTPDLLIGA